MTTAALPIEKLERKFIPEDFKVTDWNNLHPGTNAAEIVIDISANDATQALEKIADTNLLEDICDNLAFRYQQPIHTVQLEAIDITPPVSPGETRDNLLYPYPNGYKHPKFDSTFSFGTATELRPELRADFSFYTERDRAVFRWHHKALAATSTVEKFIFLMVCLEILSKSYSGKVKEPYTARCGCTIENCPTCKKTTSKEVNGKTLISFLTQELETSDETAKLIWKLRQMVHGAIALDKKSTSKMFEMCEQLNRAVLVGIKKSFRVPDYVPPTLKVGAASIKNTIYLAGQRQLLVEDLK